MRDAIVDFIRDATKGSGAPKRWLTLWGPPGVGKTTLGKCVGAVFPNTCRWVSWPALCRRFQERQDLTHTLHFVRESKLLVLDDIGAEHVTTATLGLLHGVLDDRIGRWTFITSNLSPNDWHARDARIASRIIRGGNVHVDCTTTDFALRYPAPPPPPY